MERKIENTVIMRWDKGPQCLCWELHDIPYVGIIACGSNQEKFIKQLLRTWQLFWSKYGNMSFPTRYCPFNKSRHSIFFYSFLYKYWHNFLWTVHKKVIWAMDSSKNDIASIIINYIRVSVIVKNIMFLHRSQQKIMTLQVLHQGRD